VTRRDREHDFVPDERLELERAVATKRADDPELELAVDYAVDDGLRVPDRKRDVEIWMLALEIAEQERDEVCAGPRGSADGERSGARRPH
jgi:hypothetical protein